MVSALSQAQRSFLCMIVSSAKGSWDGTLTYYWQECHAEISLQMHKKLLRIIAQPNNSPLRYMPQRVGLGFHMFIALIVIVGCSLTDE